MRTGNDDKAHATFVFMNSVLEISLPKMTHSAPTGRTLKNTGRDESANGIMHVLLLTQQSANHFVNGTSKERRKRMWGKSKGKGCDISERAKQRNSERAKERGKRGRSKAMHWSSAPSSKRSMAVAEAGTRDGVCV